MKFYKISRFINQKLIDFSKRHKINKVWGYPPIILIEPTNFCNAKCPLCPTGLGQLKRDKGFMDFDLYKKIIDECYLFAKDIALWNYGEPFLHPKIFEMIKYARSKDLSIFISTNGTLFSDPKNIDKIINSGLDNLIISLDGITSKTFSKYRKNISFKQTIDGLNKLLGVMNKKKIKHLKIYIQCVITKYNEKELSQIKKMALDLGIFFWPKKVNLEMVEVVNKNEWLPENEKLRCYTKTKDNQYKLKTKKNHEPCEIWQTLVINWDGLVNPCCYDYQGNINLGNLNTNKITEIWNSPELKELRREVIGDRSKIKLCQKCTLQNRSNDNLIEDC